MMSVLEVMILQPKAIWFFFSQLNAALALYAYAKFANSLGDCKMKGIYKKEVFLMVELI